MELKKEVIVVVVVVVCTFLIFYLNPRRDVRPVNLSTFEIWGLTNTTTTTTTIEQEQNVEEYL